MSDDQRGAIWQHLPAGPALNALSPLDDHRTQVVVGDPPAMTVEMIFSLADRTVGNAIDLQELQRLRPARRHKSPAVGRDESQL